MNKADVALNEIENISKEIEARRPGELCYFSSAMLAVLAFSTIVSITAATIAIISGEHAVDAVDHGRTAYIITFAILFVFLAALRVRRTKI